MLLLLPSSLPSLPPPPRQQQQQQQLQFVSRAAVRTSKLLLQSQSDGVHDAKRGRRSQTVLGARVDRGPSSAGRPPFLQAVGRRTWRLEGERQVYVRYRRRRWRRR
jgi:hypothetical protein